MLFFLKLNKTVEVDFNKYLTSNLLIASNLLWHVISNNKLFICGIYFMQMSGSKTIYKIILVKVT